MSRKGENIYHRRDGRWEGRRIVGKKEGGGYHFRYAYGKTYREVKEKLSVIRIVEGYGAAAAEGDRISFSMPEKNNRPDFREESSCSSLRDSPWT